MAHPRDCGGPGDCPLCDAVVAGRIDPGPARPPGEAAARQRVAGTAAERRYERQVYGP